MNISTDMDVKILFLCIGLVAFSSCGQDKEWSLPDTTSEQLTLELGIESQVTRSIAVEGTSFPHEAQVNVLMVDYEGGGLVDYNHSEVYTYKNPTWTTGVWMANTPEKALQLGTARAQVLIHYPAVLPNNGTLDASKRSIKPVLPAETRFGDILAGEYNGENSYFFSLASGATSSEIFLADGDVDYLVGGADGFCDKEQKKAYVKMRHCMSMIVLCVKKDPINLADGKVKYIEIKNTTASTALQQGSFDIGTARFTPEKTVGYKSTMDNFPDGSHFGMIVFPANIKQGEAEIQMKVDNLVHTIALPARNWEQGKIYIYNIVLKPTAAELVDMVNVIDWMDGDKVDFEIE